MNEQANGVRTSLPEFLLEDQAVVGKPSGPEHVDCVDPFRVLAECEAKRGIVGQYVNTQIAVAQHDSTAHDRDAMVTLRGALEYLSLPYRNHLDYRDEWRP